MLVEKSGKKVTGNVAAAIIFVTCLIGASISLILEDVTIFGLAIILTLGTIVGYTITWYKFEGQVSEKEKLLEVNLDWSLMYLFIQKTIHKNYSGERFDIAYCQFDSDMGGGYWFNDKVRMTFSKYDFRNIADEITNTEIPTENFTVDESYNILFINLLLGSSEIFKVFKLKKEKSKQIYISFILEKNEKIYRAFTIPIQNYITLKEKIWGVI
jgi:hypothetical protein